MYRLYIKENTSSKDLLKEALKDFKIANYEMIYNNFGKPYLKDIPFYFNISHKDNVTVCVVSDKEIGVDIEKSIYHEKLAKKVFTPKEQEILSQSSNPQNTFTRIWTMKESYSKLLGIGLSYGLQNIDTIKLKDNFELKEYKDYVIAIANYANKGDKS